MPDTIVVLYYIWIRDYTSEKSLECDFWSMKFLFFFLKNWLFKNIVLNLIKKYIKPFAYAVYEF